MHTLGRALTLAVTLVLTLAFVSSSPARAQSNLFTKIGGFGTQSGFPLGPEGLAVEADGNVLVTVLRFTSPPGQSAGQASLVARYSPAGQLLRESPNLYRARCVCPLPDGSVRVAGRSFPPYEVYLLSSSLQILGSTALTGSELVISLLTEPAGDVLVRRDAPGSSLSRFAANGPGLTLLDSWVPAAPGEVAVDVAGRLYIADGYGVQVYDPSGAPLFRWGAYGSGPADFHYPASCVAVDHSGVVYVASGDRVLVFASDGTWLGSFGEYDLHSYAGGGLTHIAVDETSGRIYAMTHSSWIDVFAPTPVATIPSSWGRLKALFR